MSWTNPAPGATEGRTDQGVDWGGVRRLVAVAAGTITNVYSNLSGFGQTIIERVGGNYVYYAEETSGVHTEVHPGETVGQGQEIAGSGSGGGIEVGLWDPSTGRSMGAPGYSEGKVTAAGTRFRNMIGSGSGGANAPLNWQPCTLTWYDPALGGTNSASGQPNPHSATASGQPYNANANTCAAPPQYKFGTVITFKYGGKTVTCTVNDRGGAIVGSHFDLSRHAAEVLGIIQAGMVQAQFAVGTAGGGNTPYSGTRPGGGGQNTAAIDKIFSDYTDLRDMDRTGTPPTGGIGPSLAAAGSAFLWYLSSFRDKANTVYGDLPQ